jgi:hypothetical protein
VALENRKFFTSHGEGLDFGMEVTVKAEKRLITTPSECGYQLAAVMRDTVSELFETIDEGIGCDTKEVLRQRMVSSFTKDRQAIRNWCKSTLDEQHLLKKLASNRAEEYVYTLDRQNKLFIETTPMFLKAEGALGVETYAAAQQARYLPGR